MSSEYLISKQRYEIAFEILIYFLSSSSSHRCVGLHTGRWSPVPAAGSEQAQERTCSLSNLSARWERLFEHIPVICFVHVNEYGFKIKCLPLAVQVKAVTVLRCLGTALWCLWPAGDRVKYSDLFQGAARTRARMACHVFSVHFWANCMSWGKSWLKPLKTGPVGSF